MKTTNSNAIPNNPNTMAGSLHTAHAIQLLWLLLLSLPTAVQAQFTFTNNNGAITITRYVGPGGTVVIPERTNGLPVTSIGDSAFLDSFTMTNVTIPNSVTNIGNSAFNHCIGLTSVIIPNSVATIGSYAFDRCFNLITATLGTNVVSLGNAAFRDCNSLTRVTLPDSITNIGGDVFFGCYSLSNATIGHGITNVIMGMFTYCSNLTSVTIGDGVARIEHFAFYFCTSLTGVFFMGNAPTFWSLAFEGTYNATLYYLSGTTGWGGWFCGCPSMLWDAQVQTGAASFGVRTNRFGFTITGTTNIPIVVAACTNLAGPLWVTLTNCNLTNGSIYFSDPDWTSYPARFYRLRWP